MLPARKVGALGTTRPPTVGATHVPRAPNGVHEFRSTIIDIQAEVKHRKREKEAKGVYRKGLRSRMCGYLDIPRDRAQGCEGNEQKGILGTAFKH